MTSLNINQLVLGMFRTNCYIVYNDNKEAIVIDPGDNYSKIKDTCISLELIPKAILLTHGHFDHIGAAKKLSEAYGINIYAFEEEKEVLESSAYNLSEVFGVGIAIKVNNFLKDSDIINLCGFKFKVIHTPGHTKGSCCYYLEEYSALFSGDTLFCESHGRTDFPTGSESTIIKSITEKLFKLPMDTKVFPGHNDATTIGDEIKWYRY
jgi:hydroxyacylglutathione hydrolase